LHKQITSCEFHDSQFFIETTNKLLTVWAY